VTETELVVGFAAIFVLGVGAQWVAALLRIPSILLLLVLGFLAGPVTGIIQPDEMFGDIFFLIVPLAVGVVLFEGGATLELSEVTGHGTVVRRLITWGVLLVWALAALAGIWILDLEPGLAILLGAVITVSGPTVVGPLLRAVRPSKRVRTILNWEGILIDPVGAILAVIVFDLLIEGGGSLGEGITGLLATVGAGALVGLAGAALIVLLLKNYLIPDRLQPATMLMFVLTAFTISDVLRSESGLLAVTLMGMALANQRFAPVDRILEFKEVLRDLLIGALFIMLAARVELEEITSVGWRELAFLVVLVLVARPLAVFVSTVGSGLEVKEKLFMSWVAPRGIVAAAVASVFAIELEEAGVDGAARLIPLVFFVIIGTVALYSLTGRWVGRVLGVVDDAPAGLVIIGANPVTRQLAKTVAGLGVPVFMVASNHSELTKARLEGLDAYRASVLADEAEEDENLVLVATPNDEFNALATINSIELRGRSRVFQLAPSVGSDQVAQRLRGRTLGSATFSFIEASEQMLAGAAFRATPLTEQFGLSEYRSEYGTRATPLFVVQGGEIVAAFTDEGSPTVMPGQTIVALIARDQPEAATVDREEMRKTFEESRPHEQQDVAPAEISRSGSPPSAR
jgi:NhaP-type Na+/H+ or K+/H+ antiporter